MSTNYYVGGYDLEDNDVSLDPSVHIGKTYYGGIDRGMGFIWAMELDRLEGATTIINEYGEIFTRQEFTELLMRCTHQLFESVGERWS